MKKPLIFLFVLFIACSDEPEEPINISGTWKGSTQYFYFQLAIKDYNGTLSGSAFCKSEIVNVIFTIEGKRYDKDVTLNLISQDFLPITYSAKLINEQTLKGNITGSGFNNEELILTKYNL